MIRSSLFLSLDIIIHIHQIPDGVHVVGDVGVAADGVLDGAAGHGEIDHVHGLIVVHHGVDQAAGKGVSTSSVMLASPRMVCLMALLATAKLIMSMGL